MKEKKCKSNVEFIPSNTTILFLLLEFKRPSPSTSSSSAAEESSRRVGADPEAEGLERHSHPNQHAKTHLETSVKETKSRPQIRLVLIRACITSIP